MDFSHIRDRPLKIDDFAALEKGAVVALWYNRFNQGMVIWEYSEIKKDELGRRSVWGRFLRAKPCEVGGYLYEYHGLACIASGAEPLWAVQDPKRSRLEWIHEYEEEGEEEDEEIY
jgi:hypothetical protein